ncbi:hypothetical protein ACOSP7_024110 [Xanthoceras sorbifolium]
MCCSIEVGAHGGRISIGVVVRNACGLTVMATALVFKGGIDVELAEAKAVLEGSILAVDNDFLPLLIESDCLNVVSLCSGALSYKCEIANIILDVNLILNNRDIVSSSFVPRTCNMVAHELAKRALGCIFFEVWFDQKSFPSWLLNLGASEVVSFVAPSGV